MNEKSGKKLGILGGMGSWATAYFFSKVVDKTVAEKDQDYIDTILFNHASLPDRSKAILENKTDEYINMVIGDLKILEKSSVDYIAIPCNTSHVFYERFQSEISVPIIHMPRETVSYILKIKPSIKKIGILATDGTIHSKLYENEITKQGIQAVVPSSENQKIVHSIIYDEIKSGKLGNIDSFMFVANELISNGAEVIILGCTELSYFKEKHNLPEYFVDAMEVLARRSIELSEKKYKE